MDTTQLIISFCLLLVTFTFVAIGIWVVMLLNELKSTILKTNEILDDTREITSSVSKPISSFSEFIMGFKNGFAIFNKFASSVKKHESKTE